jgi:HEAT repeat protein
VSLIGRHGEGGDIINALHDALHDAAPNVREEAAEGLGRFGPRAIAAVASLTTATKDANVRVRLEAIEALQKIRGTRR